MAYHGRKLEATRFCPFRGAFIFKVFLGELREKLLEARHISCFVRSLLSLVRHPYQHHDLLSYSILYVWLVVEYHRRSFFHHWAVALLTV